MTRIFRRRIIAFCLVFSSFIIFLAACKAEPSKPPPSSFADFGLPVIDRREVIDAISKTTTVTPGDAGAVPGNPQGDTYLIIDDSGSIRSYLSDVSQSRSYEVFVNTVFARLPQSLKYTICQGPENLQEDIKALKDNIKMPEFYRQEDSQLYTPLFAALEGFMEKFEGDGSNGGNMYVVLSDMYISGEVDQAGVPQNLIELIDEHFLSGKNGRVTTVGIVCVRLDYCGSYFDLPKLNIGETGIFASDNRIADLIEGEKLPTIQHQYINEKQPVKRPYYALFMGNAERVRSAIESIQNDLADQERFKDDGTFETGYLLNAGYLDVYPPEVANSIDEGSLSELFSVEFAYTGPDGEEITPDELVVREASLAQSGILSAGMAGNITARELEISNGLEKANALIVKYDGDFDFANNMRIKVTPPDPGLSQSTGIDWGDPRITEYRLKESVGPDEGGASTAFETSTPSANKLIDFGKKDRTWEYSINGGDFTSIDRPVLVQLTFSLTYPLSDFPYVPIAYPSWIAKWETDLGEYKNEAYRLINGKYEFVLDGGHSLPDGGRYTQYNKTPFIAELYEELYRRRTAYVERTLAQDIREIKTKEVSCVACFGIVKRDTYIQYLTNYGIQYKDLKDCFSDDGGFALKQMSGPAG